MYLDILHVFHTYPCQHDMREGGGDVSVRAHTLAASGRWVAFGPSEDERPSRSPPARARALGFVISP